MIDFIPEKRIENKAFNLLQSFSKNQSWEISLPIPIELIIETELNYVMDVMKFEDPKTLGSLNTIVKKIYTNELIEEYFNKYPGTYEYTLAHEVGHWSLHLCADENQEKIEGVPDIFVCRSGSKAPEEIQADKFAAALLMPEELVRNYVKGKNILSWPALYELRDNWKVSISAIKNRLEKLNLLYYDEDKGIFYRSKSHANGQISLFFT